jgi:lipopolysaccharide/colanic/teichoic acid biosynthesis glycosyltransferase
MALLDYCYGRTKTPWTDLRILLRTVRVLVTGEGGY